jgi:pimeloyl-ACP methyl ester carboxylesterase
MPSLIVPAADGVQLSVRVTGLPDAPAVLLCDGIGCDGYIWRYLRPWLEKHCKVVHFHYRGHGQSEIPADPSTLTIAQCGRDAWTVLDACGVQDAVLIGHSMGVQVVLEAASQALTRTRAIVAVCGAFERPLDTFQGSDLGSKVLPLLSGAFFRWPERLREVWQRAVPTEFAYWLATATEINGRMIRRDDFLPYLRHMARMDPVVFMHFLQSVADHSARPWLAQLTMPVLVIAGQKDNFTPMRCSQELVGLLSDAEMCQVPGGSHTAPLELPELIELRLEDFARRKHLWK